MLEQLHSDVIPLRIHQPEPSEGRLLLLILVHDARRGAAVSRGFPEAPPGAYRRRALFLLLGVAREASITQKHFFRHDARSASGMHLGGGSA